MTPFADRARHDPDPSQRGASAGRALLGVAALAALLTACSHGTPGTLQLREVVADWPAGLEATLVVVATPTGAEVVLATTDVDAGGAFRLTVPPPAAPLLVAVSNVYPATPECQTDLSNPAVGVVFVADFAIVGSAGQSLASLTASRVEPGGAVSSLSYVYADEAVEVHQACTYSEATFAITLDLRSGWNPFLIEASQGAGKPHYTITTDAVPVNFAWRYQERTGPAAETTAWAPTPFLAWATRQVPTEGR